MLKRTGYRKLNLLVVCLLALTFYLGATPGTGRAAEDSQVFPETGRTVSGKFLDYWRKNGGLPVYGYPITDAQPEVDPETGKTFLTQWFERNRFELHPENAGTKYEVLLGLLGKDLRREALAVDPDFQRTGARVVAGQPAQEQVYFSETGHNLRFGFLKYWQQNGGLERFGFPISEEHPEVDPETNKVFVSQWFERARFEYHPEFAGTQYEILLGLLGNQLKHSPVKPEFAWKIGGGYDRFFRPTNIATDSKNNLYVTDNLNQRVLKFSPTGDPLALWGSKGSGSGQFQQIGGIAADSQGNSYVSDSDTNRIQKFDPSGYPLAQWGSPGSDDGQLSSPGSLVLDKNGNLFVADNLNFRIQKFDSNGKFLAKWGSQGNGDGQFAGPIKLAVDSAGNLYATDTLNFRVEKFNSNGQFLTKWGSLGSGNGQFGGLIPRPGPQPGSDIPNGPAGLAVDAQGTVYVADSFNNRIEVFDSNGQFLRNLGSAGSGNGQLNSPQGLVIGAQGNLFVADFYNQRIQVLDPAGNYIAKWGQTFDAPGLFNPDFTGGPSSVAVDSAGNIYVGDVGNHRVQKFNNRGVFLAVIGDGAGNGTGQFGTIAGAPGLPINVAVDGQGNIYASDPANYRVQKFDSNGHFLLQWGSEGTGNGQFGSFNWPGGPGGIAVDPQNNVYVTDMGSNRVLKFDSNGKFLSVLGSSGLSDGQFATPWGIAIDAGGNLFVVDEFRIQKFDSSGHFITKFGRGGQGIALDKAGNVYVTNNKVSLVTKYDNNGVWQLEWGGAGSADGYFSAFNGPAGLDVDAQGSIFVVDPRNNRLEKFLTR
ncbi:MAG TPA: SMP-30/gluconolactonase/LRE family protein [Chloroflexia bacterium]|nr:SMP-30/gluconolactonase/LRE family protein [Chloroflexia bacterium]